MKRMICFLVGLIMILTMVGCNDSVNVTDNGNSTTEDAAIDENESSLVKGKYFITSSYVLRFEEENTVTIVKYSLKKGGVVSVVGIYYAVYSCEGKAIEITADDKQYTGVIIENGERIAIGDVRLEIADINNCSEQVKSAFDVK